MFWWSSHGWGKGWKWCRCAIEMPSWRRRFSAPYVFSKEDELRWLKEEERLLGEELEWIRRRIRELKNKSG